MKYDKRKLAIAVLFLVLAVWAVVCLFTLGTESYYVTGAIIFTVVGLGFLRRAKYR